MKMPPMPQVVGSNIGNPMGIRSAPKKDEAKFSDYIRQEKMRNFKRLPRLIGKRGPV